jgi:aryl-alcohol dehydrogenase-like predicted oxidoreductase
MTMRYKLLGQSGLRVAELALGTMTFGEDWGWGASREVSGKIFEAYAAAGGNFIDTACNYTEGTSEKFVGEFIQSDRDYFVVATKYTLRTYGANQRDPNAGGNARKNLRQSVEASLRRLNTGYIDLLYLHMWDFTTPIAEVLRGMDDLVRAGKVLYVGFSDTPAWIVSHAVALAGQYGWARPVTVQVPYSLANRDAERGVMPMAQTFDLAITAWGLLEGGALTGKYNKESDDPKRHDEASARMRSLAEVVMAVADELGRSPAQVAINWARQRPYAIIPLLGARTEAQIQNNLAILDFTIPQELVDRIDEAVNFNPGFPMGFLQSDGVRRLAFGKTFKLIDNHRAGN